MNPPTFSLEGVTSIKSDTVPPSEGAVGTAETTVSKASTSTDLVKAVSALVRAKKASDGFIRAETLLPKAFQLIARSQPPHEADLGDPRQLKTLINLETDYTAKLLRLVVGPIGMEQVRKVFQVEDSCGTAGVRQLLDGYKQAACKALPALKPKTPCWICGFPIQSGRTGTGALSASCDHLLPESQAPFCMDLTGTNDASFLEKTFGHAHRICTLMKQESRFVRIGTSKRLELATDAELKFMLRNLYEHGDSKIPGSGKSFKDLIGPNYTSWAASRLPAIKTRLTAMMDAVGQCSPQAVVLASLASCGSPTGSSRTRRRRLRHRRTHRNR